MEAPAGRRATGKEGCTGTPLPCPCSSCFRPPGSPVPPQVQTWKGEPPFSPTPAPVGQEAGVAGGGWRVSTRAVEKQCLSGAPHPTSRLLVIPDDGRKMQGRQGARLTSPLARQKGPMRTRGGTAGLGGQRCSEERRLGLWARTRLPWDRVSSQPAAGSSWIPGLSQHLPQRGLLSGACRCVVMAVHC